MMDCILRKSNVYLVAFSHFVLVCMGIASLVEEQKIIYEQYSLIVIVLYYSLHFVLIFTLILSVYKDQPLLMLPWLISACMVLILATVKSVLATENLEKGVLYYAINFVFIGAYWFAWFVVFRYFQEIVKSYRESLPIKP